MLETIKHYSLRNTIADKRFIHSLPHRHVQPSHNKTAPHKIVNLAFQEANQQEQHRFRYTPNTNRLDMGFKTFYQNGSHKKHKSQSRYTSLSARDAAFSQRHSVIGTPFATLQIKQVSDITNPMLPSMDRERYKYLLKAISGLRKGNKLTEFTSDRIHKNNPEELYPNISLKFADPPREVRTNYHKTHPLKKSNNDKLEQINKPDQREDSPKIINLSSEFKVDVKSQEQLSPRNIFKENPFQKIFKGKQMLHSKYKSKQMHRNSHFEVSLVSDDELIINKLTLRHEKNEPKQSKNKN